MSNAQVGVINTLRFGTLTGKTLVALEEACAEARDAGAPDNAHLSYGIFADTGLTVHWKVPVTVAAASPVFTSVDGRQWRVRDLARLLSAEELQR